MCDQIPLSNAAAALRSLSRVYEELLSRASAGVSRQGQGVVLREMAALLQDSGIPAFARLGETLDRFIQTDTPEALLDAAALAVLLSRSARISVREAGETVIPATAVCGQLSYRRLVEAREALNGRSSNRLEVLSDYYADGGADARLVPWLADALNDREPGIRVLARSQLLELGPSAVPIIEMSLNLQRANALDARKAEVVARLRLKSPEGVAFCARCLYEGGGAVRAAVLAPLAELGGEEGRRRVVHATEDLSKTVREAAFRALSRSYDAVEPLECAARTSDYRAALQALGNISHPDAEAALLRLGQYFQDGEAMSPRALGAVADALGRRGEKTSASFAFLAKTLERFGESHFAGEHALGLEVSLTQALVTWGTSEALDVLERFLPRAQMPVIIAELALRLHTPEDFYLRYGEACGGDIAPVRGLLLNRLTEESGFPLDRRWSALFRERNDSLMAALTAQPDDAEAEMYLREMLERLTASCPNP